MKTDHSHSGELPEAQYRSTPPPSPKIAIYVGVLVLAGMGAVVALVHEGPQTSLRHVLSATGLVTFAIMAELLTYRLPGGGTGSVALIPYMAVVLIAPEWPTVLAVTVAVALEKSRYLPPIKTIFNAAQTALAFSLGILAFRALGGQALDELGAGALLHVRPIAAGTALLAAFVLVNTVSVSGVIALQQGRSLLAVWTENTLGTATYYIFSLPFAYGLAWVYVHFGPFGAAAVAVPMIGVRQLYVTTLQLQRTNRELLELMVKAIEARDPYTSGHSRRVADAATIIARTTGMSTREVERVRVAALLHDIGKIDESFAPILQKEGKLTEDEWRIMKLHPVKGAELVATLSDLHDVVAPIRHHHERWDGRGYPDGIAGETIPLAARIITFADTMDAMMTDRPYRRALTADEVRAEFQKNAGSQFDPALCSKVLSDATWSQLFPSSTVVTSRAVRLRTPLGVRTMSRQRA
jgi:putative nucleotidyltransferase with HDIG domain